MSLDKIFSYSLLKEIKADPNIQRMLKNDTPITQENLWNRLGYFGQDVVLLMDKKETQTAPHPDPDEYPEWIWLLPRTKADGDLSIILKNFQE